MWFDGLFYMTVLCLILAVGAAVSDYIEMRLKISYQERKKNR